MSSDTLFDFNVTDDDSSPDESFAVDATDRMRGVKRGMKRGPYKKVGADARQRIIDCYKAGGDWKLAATANGVAVQTAYGYLKRGEGDGPRKRGGATHRKVDATMVEKMLEYVEENGQITLAEIANKLHEATGVRVSTNTVHKHLNGKLYTLKVALPQPTAMNSAENKRKRAAFVRRVMEVNGRGKTVIYMDETNCNLFLRRSQGRSRRGTRCTVKTATGKGANIHVIGAITQTGMLYWERRRGSFRKEECCEWLRRALRSCQEPLDRIVVVCDNAPVHRGLETVVEEPEFQGVELLRTAPYSAPLNPIEACWSGMKAEMKRTMSSTFWEMMRTEDGLTQTEHRLRYLERRIDAAVPVITPLMCLKVCSHVQRHYASCLALEDLPMGV